MTRSRGSWEQAASKGRGLRCSPAYKFPTELKRLKYEIEAHASDYGLDFFPVIFELLDYRELNEVAAYGGFPYRYPHWRFGMQYEELSRGHTYGLAKIYEMVINNDPCYAYLLKCNNLVDQKLVMAHVYAHCDFFKNNLYFAHTNRKMVDEMANHAARIHRYIERYGTEQVEAFIDCCLSLENLIDPHGPFIRRRREKAPSPKDPAEDQVLEGPYYLIRNAYSEHPSPTDAGPSLEDPFGDRSGGTISAPRLRSKHYMDPYINPPEFIRERKEKIVQERMRMHRFPEQPEPDVLLFLLENAPLKNWQRNILSIIREEAYYFLPQAQTKIMNEGWATYWHSKIMTEKVLRDEESIDYADHHSGTLAGSRLGMNPYKLGVELFRDIEERWDKGRFGKQYEECDDLVERKLWDKRLGLGRKKIFEVRRLYNDLTFIDTFLTEDFCRKQRLFVYEKEEKTGTWRIRSRDFKRIKETLLKGITNLGHPMIRVGDGNFRNRGELLLVHIHEGTDLEENFAKETLKNLYRLWKRPVHVETKRHKKRIMLSFDGKEHRLEDLC